MPISLDFESIVAPFRPPVRLQMRILTGAFERLGRWLAPRLRETERLERETRAFPILRFYDGALTVRLDRSQRGGLTPDEGPPTIWEGLAAAGRRFVGGIRMIGTSVCQEWLLPGLFSDLADLAQEIMDSVDRFRRPTPGMFDPRQRTWTDLFGEAALALRAFLRSMPQIREFAAGGLELRRALAGDLQGGAPEPSAPTPDQPLEVRIQAWAESLENVLRYLVAGLMLIPVLPHYLMLLVEAGGIRARVLILERFRRWEAQLFARRRQVIDFFAFRLLGHLRKAYQLVEAVAQFLGAHLRFFTGFVMLYGLGVLSILRNYTDDLTRFFQFWTNLVEAVRSALEAFLDFDLMPLILAAMGPVGWIIAAVGSPPRFTIGDLFDTLVAGGVSVARTSLEAWLANLELAVEAAGFIAGSPDLDHIGDRIRALRQVLNISLTPRRPLPAETRLPNLTGITFPNFFDAFFGPAAPNLRRALGDLATAGTTTVTGILDSTVRLLREAGTVFDEPAARAARLGSPANYRALAAGAAQLAETALGDQTTALRERIAGRAASQFESWVATGGFALVGEFLPGYIAAMRRRWHEQAERRRAELPTSPHIVDRRARLGRVRMQEMRLRVGAPAGGAAAALDDALIGTLSLRFKTAVEDAFRTGRAQHEAAMAR